MTNKKIKDYIKNKPVYDVLTDNFKMLCIFMLSLHEIFPKQFYQKNVQEWFEEYSDSCKMMNDYEEDGAYDYKMEGFCKKCGIDDDICMKIICKHLKKHHPKNMLVLKDNLKLMLIQTSLDYGFGKERLTRLTEHLLESDYPDWEVKIRSLGFDFEYDMGSVDFDKLKPKKQRSISLSEQREALAKLQAYKDYTDRVTMADESSHISK